MSWLTLVFCIEKLIFLPFLDLADWVGERFVANSIDISLCRLMIEACLNVGSHKYDCAAITGLFCSGRTVAQWCRYLLRSLFQSVMPKGTNPCYGVQYFGLFLTSIYTIKHNFSLGHSQILSIASGWPEIN